METLILYRPVNQAELTLIEQLNWQRFPPRLPQQPIFYPVLDETYAREITERWNVPAYGAGFVVSFKVDKEYASKFEVQNVGLAHHNELWVPSEELEEFNDHIIATIEPIAEYHPKE